MSGTPKERLALLEHQIAAQQAALEASPPWEPLPPAVLALLSAPVVELSLDDVASEDMPRVVDARRRLDAVMDELTARQLRVSGRLSAARQASQPHRLVHLFEALG